MITNTTIDNYKGTETEVSKLYAKAVEANNVWADAVTKRETASYEVARASANAAAAEKAWELAAAQTSLHDLGSAWQTK